MEAGSISSSSSDEGPGPSAGVGAAGGGGVAAGAGGGGVAADPNKNSAAKLRYLRDADPTVLVKGMGLKALIALLTSLKRKTSFSSKVNEVLLRKFTSIIKGFPALSLFEDWSPPAASPEALIKLQDTDVAVDSTRSGGTFTGVRRPLAFLVPCWCMIYGS